MSDEDCLMCGHLEPSPRKPKCLVMTMTETAEVTEILFDSVPCACPACHSPAALVEVAAVS